MLSRARGATYIFFGSWVGSVQNFTGTVARRGRVQREGRGTASVVNLVRWTSGTGTAVKNIAGTAPRAGTASVGIMSVSKEVVALRADLERVQKEKETIRWEADVLKAKTRECETEIERLRRERSWGTSFDRQGGGNSADRRGTAASTMGPMWTRGVSSPGGLRQSLPNFPRGIVAKFPVECFPSEYITWEQRFEFFIANQGLRHTISLDVPEIAVISCTNNAYLFGQFGEELVVEHRQVWGYISEATADAPFEISLYKFHSISDALRMMREWSLPLYPAERHLLVAELERVQFMGDEESEIVQFILRQFLERPSHPHALVVGRGFRDGGAVGGGSMPRQQQQLQQDWSRDGGMPRQQQQLQQDWSRDGGRQQQQLQQHWSRDSGIPRQQQQLQHWSRDGGMPRQQQQLQQHLSRDGGMPRQQQQLQQHWSPYDGIPRQQQQQQQQQWSRGGGNPHQHQRSSHTVPPARPARQQPSRGIHTSGGDGEHGRNPLSAPATETVPDTSVFPAASSKAVAEAPTSSAGAASTAVPAAAPATGGTVFPTTSVGGATRAPAPADETAASKAASTASGTVPSATPLREAVGARESSAGAASSDAVSKAAPATSGTVTSATPLRGAVGARESSAGAAPSDVAAEAFPLAVRYNNNSSSSSNSNNSSSSNDTTTTCAVALLRPFDPGKGCQRDAKIGVILGLDLHFDRGKA